MFFLLIFLVLLLGNLESMPPLCHEKVLICGICKNVSKPLSSTIQNIEILGECCADYAVLIYENNSKDDTVEQLVQWAQNNSKVYLQTEYIPKEQLPLSRTEKIARARNKVLQMAKDPKFKQYRFLIMADMDLQCAWPIEEIMQTINSPIDWDSVSANGLLAGKDYRDRYAFRDKKFPFGPELLGEKWWEDLNQSWFQLKESRWIPVYSAFGGLAIYKTATILRYNYSGTTTQDLEKYYRRIASKLPRHHPELLKYLQLNKIQNRDPLVILFRPNTFLEHPENYAPVTCCEHITLHASMAVHGNHRFYINPKMKLYY